MRGVLRPPAAATVHRRRVAGVLEFRPAVHGDHRGRFVTPFLADEVEAATGSAFRVEQASSSRSRRSVLRGVHFTRTPPGVRKFVFCPVGEIRDIVVDLRVGSPTYKQWDSVVLTAEAATALYLPVGVGHAFASLRDGSVMSYLLTRGYVPDDELSVSLRDPELGLPVGDLDPDLLSPRDRDAPTLREAAAQGLLPDWADCRRLEPGLDAAVAR